LRARCGGAAASAPLEVEQALELGFAKLIALEAQLQKAQAAEQAAEQNDLNPLVNEIEDLRGELEQLRAVTASGPNSSPVAWGFVLPSEAPRR
jgi:hypothetical protein